jgi:hypothetical protein
MVDTVLLSPLPFPDADRLVVLPGAARESDLPHRFGLGPEFYVHYKERQARQELAERVGVFQPVSRDPNRDGHFQYNSREANNLAFADSVIRFRPFASVCEFSQRNDTRNDTRRERLPKFLLKEPRSALDKCPSERITLTAVEDTLHVIP